MQHLQRRIQFGQLTGDLLTNQSKVSEMMSKLQIGRLLTYYAAYCADIGKDTSIEAAIAKKFNTDACLSIAIDAIQCMGGNGVTKYYPVERIMRDAKLMQIAGGTNEILALLIYRQGLRKLMPYLKVPPRAIDEELGVPMPLGKMVQRVKAQKDEDVLKVLSENFRVNPGLHMRMEDIMLYLDVEEQDLVRYLSELEKKGFASLFRDKRGRINLARVTNAGLEAANPPEHYKYIPLWVDKNDLF